MIEKLLTISVGKKEQPFHWHKTMELDLILEGEADVLVNNRADHVKKGDLVVVNREDMHCIENATSDFLCVQFFFNMEAYNQYISDIWTQYFKCTPEEDDAVSINLKEEIKYYMSNIIAIMESDQRSPDAEKTLISHSIEIIGCLTLGFKAIVKDDSRKGEEYYDRLWKIIDYMYDNSNRKLPISEVAGHVYLSEAYITKLMKESTGLSFEEFLGYVRVEDSIRYLLGSDMSVTNVAYEVGFSAPRYFNATFEKHFGCSPKTWRERYKNFFKMDSSREVAHVVYEEGTNKAYVLELIQTYNVYGTVNSSNETNIDLSLDISKEIQQHGVIPHKSTAIICEAEEIMNYDGLMKLKECYEILGINRIKVTAKNVKLKELAIKNAEKIGYKSASEEFLDEMRCIALEDLYSMNGVKRYGFHRQKLVSLVQEPYDCVDNTAVAYGDSDNYHVIVFNDDEALANTYLMNLTGMELESVYAIKKQHVRAVPKGIFDKLNVEIVMDENSCAIMQQGFDPQETVEFITGKRSEIFEVLLEPQELCHFELKKLT